MLDVNDFIFPNNVVVVAAEALGRIDEDIEVFKRPLRNTDPQQSVGIHAQLWDPNEESYEMMGLGNQHPVSPTLQRYYYGVQAFVKDGEEERGLSVHATLGHAVRSVLYTDAELRVALTRLKVDYSDGSSERLQRWGITNARYFSGEIEGTNLYLSTLEFWVETETH